MKSRKPDNAAFDPQAAERVWGSRPTCVVTCGQHVDLHHILGRGLDHGARPGQPERYKFGSILNCVPLCPEVHHGPLRDSREMRHMFLRIAGEAVEWAVIHEGYLVDDRDVEFTKFRKLWLEKNPVD